MFRSFRCTQAIYISTRIITYLLKNKHKNYKRKFLIFLRQERVINRKQSYIFHVYAMKAAENHTDTIIKLNIALGIGSRSF